MTRACVSGTLPHPTLSPKGERAFLLPLPLAGEGRGEGATLDESYDDQRDSA
jgi:hypothetical protein